MEGMIDGVKKMKKYFILNNTTSFVLKFNKRETSV